MNLEQAQLLKKKLQYLEGLIAWNSREYIWKVVIGPKDLGLIDQFMGLVSPSIPIDTGTILRSFGQEELSVYFFLKTKGRVVCREYREFLSANDLKAPDDDHTPAMQMLNE